jgi:ubiquinone/menaquinone biosynthesis C-methylase UbiE
MGVYNNFIVPNLTHLAMRQEKLRPYRRRVVANASGRVLEIGVGSGLNLSMYPRGVRELIALDTSPKLLQRAQRVGSTVPYPVELVYSTAESIPLDDSSVDNVVTSWTLCSIPDVTRALREVRRVLRSEGRLLFVEHGRSPDMRLARWQDRLTPMWKRLAGGCHLNRPIREIIEQAGFQIEHLDTGYLSGPNPMTFMYEGVARPNRGA